MATWILIMSLWGDALISQKFTSQERCEAAGLAMQKAKAGSIVFICAEE